MKIDLLVGRARRHWMQDGVVELTLGIQFFLVSIIFLIGAMAPRDSEFRNTWTMAACWIWAGLSLASVWVTRQLKERVIAPRAGYVTLRESCGKPGWRDLSTTRGIATLATVAISAGIVALGFLIRMPKQARDEMLNRSGWMIGLTFALVFMGVFVWSALRYRMKRYFLLALLSASFAVWIYGRTGAVVVQVTVLLMCVGLGYAGMGAWRLWEFLKANPIIERDAE